MSQPHFDTTTTEHVAALAIEFARSGSRRINAVHLHHTFIPDAALFHDLAARLGGTRAAGLELCRRMWRVHTEHNGWSDIAQHVTIDPVGTIWIGRAWSRPPASASGFNGNRTVGPFMIELIGNFDAGREEATKPQKAAMLATIGAVQDAFGLPPDALAFHSELDDGKSCPGGTMDRAALVKKLRRASVTRGAAHDPSGPTVPFPAECAVGHEPPGGGRGGTNARGDEWREHEGDAEIDEHALPFAAIELLSARPGGTRSSRDGSRGGARPTLTPTMLRALRPHVVNLRQGRFSNDGDFRTTAEDVERLVERDLSRWIDRQVAGGKPARVMIHAHGGLNDESHALLYAYRFHDWWLKLGVYPIYFVWETGARESILQVLEEYRRRAPGGRGGGSRGFLDDLWDRAVERFVNRLATDPWTIMKLSAERASEEVAGAGATYLAERLEQLRVRYEESDTAIEFHAVGHSAGAIFQAYFLEACRRGERRLAFRTLSLLAPACTVELFDALLRPPMDHGLIGHLNLFCLDRERERSDSSVPAYSKSLLHLVSKGFERPSGTPILGMQDAIERDDDLYAWLGLGARERPEISVVFAPTDDTAARLHRTEARQHGDFSSDGATLRSLATRIVGTDADPVMIAPPAARGDRDIAPWFPPLAEKLDPELYETLFGSSANASGGGVAVTHAATTSSVHRPDGAPAPMATGRGRALCIGIDDYPGDQALKGCVNDARLWANTLGKLGLQAKVLEDGQASHAGILDAIREHVALTGPGEILVIQYSGHGIQFDDKDGDELDGKDEAIVPHDSAGALFIADDELWDALEGGGDDAWIYVFMDCCHSLTNSRAMGPRPGHTPRLIDPEPGWRAAHRARLSARGRRAVPQNRTNAEQRHYKYAACRDDQLAYESDGHGKFTLAALAALAALGEGAAVTSNVDFLERALEHFDRGADQTPGIDCRPDWRGRPFLGGLLAR